VFWRLAMTGAELSYRPKKFLSRISQTALIGDFALIAALWFSDIFIPNRIKHPK